VQAVLKAAGIALPARAQPVDEKTGAKTAVKAPARRGRPRRSATTL
jgi:hypothetical protein